MIGFDRTCGIHFLNETVGVGLLSSSRRSHRGSQRRPIADFSRNSRRKVSQNTHQTSARKYRQRHPRRLLPRSRSPLLRCNMQTHQNPQNQQRRRNQINLVLPPAAPLTRLMVVISTYIIRMHRRYDKSALCRTLRLSKKLGIFSSLKKDKAKQ